MGFSQLTGGITPPPDIACCIGRKNFYAKFFIWDGSYNLTVCLHLMEPIWWHLDSNPWPHVTLRPLAHLNQEHLFDQLFTVSQSILEDDLPAAVTPDDDVIKLPEVELEKFVSNVRTLVGIFRLATCPVWWFVVTELYSILSQHLLHTVGNRPSEFRTHDSWQNNWASCCDFLRFAMDQR